MFNDECGHRIPRGRTVREETYTALFGPPPLWLQVAAGVGAWVDPVTALGHYRVSGTGTLALRTIPIAMDWSGQEWIAFTVCGVHFTGATVGVVAGIALKSDNLQAGVAVFDGATTDTCVLRLLGAGVPDIPIRYQWAGAELGRRRDLTIAIGTADKSVWLMEGRDVFHHGTYPALRLDEPLRGVLDASTTVAVQMRILAARLRVETN